VPLVKEWCREASEGGPNMGRIEGSRTSPAAFYASS
jgi:hypothetical protein